MQRLYPVIVLVLFSCVLLPIVGRAATYPGIDPCSLVVPAEVYAVFPKLKTMKKQTIGPNTTCSYLDGFGLSGLIVSVHRDDGISAHAMMENLGDGYTVQDVPGLGSQAAMAVTKGDPQYGIEGGIVAELYIKKGKTSLLIAPARIEVKATGAVFEKLRGLAQEMLRNVP